MLQYSFSSVYMAVITSNILLILITLLFRNHKMMINIGYKLLALFIVLTILRFALPFELPFTATVLLTDFKVISLIIVCLRHSLFTIGDIQISIWIIFELVWLVGVIVIFYQYLRLRRKTRYYILANTLDCTAEEPYHSLMERICREHGKRNPFRILRVSGISVPMVYGILRPCILIPEKLELREEEWYYILSHEASHHFHHDLLIKTLSRLVTMVYWWNPAGHILNRQVDVVLEMRVDNVVAAYSKETILKYLRCLTAVGEHITEASTVPRALTLSLLTNEDSALLQRYHMLISAGQKKIVSLNILLFLLIIGIYAFSHRYTFEANYTAPEVAENTMEATAASVYAIQNDDGSYDVYFMGYYTETTDSLEYYPSDIPIYTEKEISNEN